MVTEAHSQSSIGSHCFKKDYLGVEVVDGKLELRDQMRQYADRGDALEDHNYLDFFINTYEGSPAKESTGDKSRKPGRPPNVRVPYQDSSVSKKTCRIIRSDGHETLPRIVGQWFPRNDDPSTDELYCASMMALLAPWRSLDNLKADDETFRTSFDRFLKTTSPRILRFLSNIQYFYECSDGTS